MMRTHVGCFVKRGIGVVVAAVGVQLASLHGAWALEFPWVEKKLGNGLRVLVVEDPTFPVVSYQTWMRVGSVDERFGATGLAHLFEHLMFKGTQKFGPKEFFNQLETRGALVNAYTTRDYTVYHEDFSPPLLERVIEMESDRMQGLVLTQELLESERRVVFEERRMRTDNSPAGRMHEALWLLAYKVHPYRYPVIGLPQDLASIQLAEIQSFYKKHYVPANALVVVVGAVDSKKVIALVEKYYGRLPKSEAPSRRDIPAEPEPDTERQLVLEDEIATEQFALGYPVPSARETESFAVDVLANILFEGPSSRLAVDLVENKNLATGIGGSSLTPTFPGLLMIAGVMRVGKSTADAVAALDQVVASVKKDGVSVPEVQKAVRQLTMNTYGQVRTGQGLGQLIGLALTVLGSETEVRTVVRNELEKYRKVTPEDVQKAAIKFLNPNRRSVVTLRPRHAVAQHEVRTK